VKYAGRLHVLQNRMFTISNRVVSDDLDE